ncbi:uncharacterized protein LOC117117808 [Anneissia japonica]|uniref:uncharacterized protein LOC117117808 n=1 Tax=Anneissia japonica TaxID=1529436 RepID=UPI001425A8C2|nr:uncharacterized protein LOC117117808 [Anneissia japonica]
MGHAASSPEHVQGMTDSQFNALKMEVAMWYDNHKCLTMLKVLFRDHVVNERLSKIDKTADLLNDLVKHGHLNSKNLTILHDTISITEHFGLQHKIKVLLPSSSSFADVKEGNISKQFSHHRQKLMKFGMNLTPDNVTKIDGLLNTPYKEYTDGWSMITDLEDRQIIREKNMKVFTDSLRILEIHPALNALEDGMTDTQFNALKMDVAVWYDNHKCLTMLKVLFRDHVANERLSKIDKTVDLLNDLVKHGHLNSENLTILHDTISITKHKSIKVLLPSFPDVKEGTISKQFSHHRQKLMKFGMNLTPDNVTQIDGFLNTPCNEYSDRWSMITDLEDRQIINEKNMKEFSDSLKSLEVHPALNALQYGMNLEIISRKIQKNWKKIGALLGFGEEELNVIKWTFFDKASLEMLRRLMVKMDVYEFESIIVALELSKEKEIPAEILARGPDALKVYQAALEEGESDFNLVRLMVMGQENVGKTCLINSLLGKEFNKEHNITEVIAMTRSIVLDETDNTKWTEKEIDHKDEIKDQHENALASKAAEDLQKIEVLSSPEYTEDEFKDKHENALASNAAEGLQKIEVVSSPEYAEGPSDDKNRKPQKDGM